MPHSAAEASTLVERALAGFVRAHADIVEMLPGPPVLRARRPHPDRRVGLVSGGGSGHEPLHIGFVGEGMLDAACPGKVFTSPHNRQIYEASKAVAGPGGVVHIVKNYTGDVINFAIAAERLAADGIRVGRVIVDDDLATDDAAVGRRGTGATLIVEKILGAAADRGTSLDELVRLGESLVSGARSLAVATAAHRLPGQGDPAFEIPVGAVEYGVGIHGERSRLSLEAGGAAELVSRMVGELVEALDGVEGEPIVFVNGLGGLAELALYALADEVCGAFESRGLAPVRLHVAAGVTALDMSGFSLTVAKVSPAALELWDAPAHTAAWITGGAR
ncbi:MAG: dihydroxyacetone kinase subunit DhaK [Microbacterium sp.]